MMSSNNTKNILSLSGAGIVAALLLVWLWFSLQDNIDLLQVKITNLDKQVQALPKKEKFLLARLSLEKDIASLEKEKITLKNNASLTIVQAVGALSIIATAFLSWRNVKTAEANLKATEEKLVTERFSKAVELLASEKLEMRLGGIYALERIAKDSEKDYWQVMEVLTAFIRQNKTITIESEAKPYKIDYDEYDARYIYNHLDEYYVGCDYSYEDYASPNEDYVHPIEVDIQAILTVLGRREEPKKNHQRQTLDIQRTDLRGVILAGNFANVNFLKVDLQYAIIIEKADFSKSLGLSLDIKRAKNWEQGIYSPELKKKLGIDNN